LAWRRRADLAQLPRKQENPMATFVVLAGATAAGWYMRPLATRLRRAGHEVYTPTYTGLGERSHLLTRDIDLETYILDVLQVFHYEDLHDVILVGKSFSGMVITGVADRIPERIGQLVYLDAAMPDAGQAAVDLLAPEVVAMAKELVQSYGDGWLIPADPSVDQRLSPQPLRTFEQPLHLHNHAARTALPTSYIFCANKPADSMVTHMTHDGRQKAQSRGWRTFELPTDHEPERAAPDELAAILLSLAHG